MRHQLIPFSLMTAVLCLFIGSGCGGTQPAVPPKPSAGGASHGHDHADHDHPEEGPHHGQLIELGKEEYHAELVHDDASHTATIYLLDAHAEKAVPVELSELNLSLIVDGKPRQFSLAANPQTTDPEGSCSRFSSSDEDLSSALDAEGTTGRLNIEIDGQAFVGKVEHHDHDAH